MHKANLLDYFATAVCFMGSYFTEQITFATISGGDFSAAPWKISPHVLGVPFERIKTHVMPHRGSLVFRRRHVEFKLV